MGCVSSKALLEPGTAELIQKAFDSTPEIKPSPVSEALASSFPVQVNITSANTEKEHSVIPYQNGNPSVPAIVQTEPRPTRAVNETSSTLHTSPVHFFGGQQQTVPTPPATPPRNVSSSLANHSPTHSFTNDEDPESPLLLSTAEQKAPPPRKGASTEPADPSDPWASLQNQYRIKDDDAGPSYGGGRKGSSKEASLSTPGRGGSGYSKPPLGSFSGPPAGGGGSGGFSGKRGKPDGYSNDNILVLGDDDDFRVVPANRASRNPAASSSFLPPLKQPRQGGWGSGDMASAGTLMIGEDYLTGELDPPGGPGGYGSGGGGSSSNMLPPITGRGAAGQPRCTVAPNMGRRNTPPAVPEAASRNDCVTSGAKPNSGDELVFEDLEDVDLLLETEMAYQGLGPSLDAKLRQFEARQEDSYDDVF